MALIDAIKRGDTLEQIREQGLINEDGCLEADDLHKTPLHCAIERKDGDLAHALIEQCPDLVHKPTDIGETPLMYAAQYQLEGIAQLLLEHQADPNVQSSFGHVALFAAATFLQLSIIKLLVTAGAHLDVHANMGLQVMHFVAEGIVEQGNGWEVVEYLHEQEGVNPNPADDTGMHPATTLYNFDTDYGDFYMQTIGAMHGS